MLVAAGVDRRTLGCLGAPGREGGVTWGTELMDPTPPAIPGRGLDPAASFLPLT